jgi:hypothetical protein
MPPWGAAVSCRALPLSPLPCLRFQLLNELEDHHPEFGNYSCFHPFFQEINVNFMMTCERLAQLQPTTPHQTLLGEMLTALLKPKYFSFVVVVVAIVDSLELNWL